MMYIKKPTIPFILLFLAIFNTTALAEPFQPQSGAKVFTIPIGGSGLINGRLFLTEKSVLIIGFDYTRTRSDNTENYIIPTSGYSNLNLYSLAAGFRRYLMSNHFFLESNIIGTYINYDRKYFQTVFNGTGYEPITIIETGSNYSVTIDLSIGTEYFFSPFLSMEGKLGISGNVYDGTGNSQQVLDKVELSNKRSYLNFFTSGVSLNIYW